jgi:hypothetical protein
MEDIKEHLDDQQVLLRKLTKLLILKGILSLLAIAMIGSYGYLVWVSECQAFCFTKLIPIGFTLLALPILILFIVDIFISLGCKERFSSAGEVKKLLKINLLNLAIIPPIGILALVSTLILLTIFSLIGTLNSYGYGPLYVAEEYPLLFFGIFNVLIIVPFAIIWTKLAKSIKK